MLIELAVKRQAGSYISMPLRESAPDKIYWFRPIDADGRHVRNSAEDPYRYRSFPHVAEVAEPEHIRKFLGVPEYAPYGSEARAEAVEKFGDVSARSFQGQPKEPAQGQPEGITEIVSDAELDNAGAMSDPATDDAVLQAFANQLIGINDPNNKDELVTYMQANYGVDADKSLSAAELIRQIYAFAYPDQQ